MMKIADLCNINGITDTNKITSNRCIVKISTSTYADHRGLHSTKHIRYLRRKCEGFNFVEEDISCIGAEYVFKDITNIYECTDGTYEIIPCNEQYDFESGTIDSYLYKLIPYEDR